MLAYFRPLFEICLVVLGEWWFHVRFEEDQSKFSRYIIQITSVGREVERVNEIISEIRSYPMSMATRSGWSSSPGTAPPTRMRTGWS